MPKPRPDARPHWQQRFCVGSCAEQARSRHSLPRHCDAAKADVASAQARLAATQVEQARTVLAYPFDGTVARSWAKWANTPPFATGRKITPAVDLIDDRCLVR